MIGGKITQKLLRLFDVATVIGVLRLYFLELPGSLLNGDEYETVKIIYSSGKGRALHRPSRTIVSGSNGNTPAWHGATNLFNLLTAIHCTSGLPGSWQIMTCDAPTLDLFC
jgi:hypothetical protein